MRPLTIAIITIALLFLSCQNNVENLVPPSKSNFENTENKPSENAVLLAKSKVFKRGFRDNDFGFLIETEKAETSTIKIRSNGLATPFNQSLELKGHLVDAYFLDLNNDSFKELYLIIKPNDKSRNLEILGFGTDQLAHATPIIIDETDLSVITNEDKIFIRDNKLFRSFESNDKKQLFVYNLQSQENKLILKALEINSNSN